MRLLHAETQKLISPRHGEKIPYAILSHTWGDDEVMYQDIIHGNSDVKHRIGYTKLEGVCTRAIKAGFRYVWIDSCCIDQSSSAELSEAINSMFHWYRNAEICFAHLEDVDQPVSGTFDQGAISQCRWLTRGWTLQELIAPKEIIFVDRQWKDLGSRSSLAETISESTNISRKVLLSGSKALSEQSVARRMSWAARRQTTRPEDIAYCLLGLFDVHIPLLYGEGAERAFIRLQEEIVRTSSDQSILAWTPCQPAEDGFRGAFAIHPIEFETAFSIVPSPLAHATHSVVERGLQIRPATILRRKSGSLRAVIDCHEQDNFESYLAIPLIKFPGTTNDVLVRHPEYAPLAIDHALIESRFSYNNKGITTLGALTDSDLDILFSWKIFASDVAQEFRSYFLLLRTVWSRLLGMHGHTIFIPKFPRKEHLSIDHLQVGYDRGSVSILGAYPIEAWNPRSDTFVIRKLDPNHQSGVLIFKHWRLSKPFAIGFCIDPTGLDAYVHFPKNSPSDSDDLGRLHEDLKQKMPAKDMRWSKWAEVKISSQVRAKATVRRASIIGRPVWSVELEFKVSDYVDNNLKFSFFIFFLALMLLKNEPGFERYLIRTIAAVILIPLLLIPVLSFSTRYKMITFNNGKNMTTFNSVAMIRLCQILAKLLTEVAKNLVLECSLFGLIVGFPEPISEFRRNLLRIAIVTVLILITWFLALRSARKLHERNFKPSDQTNRTTFNSVAVLRLRRVLVILSAPISTCLFTFILLRYIGPSNSIMWAVFLFQFFLRE
jgi:hypothetical protein